MFVIRALGWLLIGMAGAGSLYMLAAAAVLRRVVGPRAEAPTRDDPVSILKPLHGAEPRLSDNLASMLDQRHDGPIQLLCGLHAADDPASDAVRRLHDGPRRSIETVIDPRAHGANGKVSNLINLEERIAHPTVIVSDSDIAVAPDYLARLFAALDAPGVGAVTCLYRGRGDAGLWSRLGAAGLSYQFLPGAAFGVATGLARPCMGSTIAMRRETLTRIGGFARFADVLADDHAIGAAVRATGLEVVVPPMLVVHASAETSLAELWRHELRWGATVRDLAPGAYAASIIALPLPLAVLGLALMPGPAAGAIVLLAGAARWIVKATVDRLAGERTAPSWMLPLRDMLSFLVFVASFCTRSVDWRGSRLRMVEDGQIAAVMEFPR